MNKPYLEECPDIGCHNDYCPFMKTVKLYASVGGVAKLIHIYAGA